MKKIYLAKWIVAISLAVVLAAGCSGTQKASAPMKPDTAASADWRFHEIVGVDFVQQYVKVPAPKDVLIIDARPKRVKYDKGHIPTAVSIPDSKFDEMTAMLPADKDTLLIFYCGGLKCPLSHKSARKAEKIGYTNVKVFAEGFPKWMSVPGNYAAVSVEWLKRQMDAQAAMVLIDSRPKRAKYDKGHIPGAISIPDSKFEKMTDQLPADKDAHLVFYCGGFKCPLSHKSASKAIAMGYKNVKVFAAGYPEWKSYIAKLEGPKSVASAAVKSGTEEGSIDIETFVKAVRENPSSIHIIDVREPEEFAAGSFKTAVNMPVDKLETQIDSLPTDKPVVFVCNTGARSGESYYMVKDLRPGMQNVYYLEAEITFNEDGTFKVEAPKG